MPYSDPVNQSQQSLVLEVYPANQLVGSKFDSGDLTLLLIGSACSKDLMFAARGTSELPLTLNFHNTADSKPKAASRTSRTQDNLYYFRISFPQTKTAFGNEKVPKVSIEVGCQVSLVGHHIEEPAVFCVSDCPYFPNRKRSTYVSAHVIRFPKTQLLILLRLLWMTSFVWDAEVVEHFLLLVRISVDPYRRIQLNTSRFE